MVNFRHFIFGFAICTVCLYGGYVHADDGDTGAFCNTMCSDPESTGTVSDHLVDEGITALCLNKTLSDNCYYDKCVQAETWHWEHYQSGRQKFNPKQCDEEGWNAQEWEIVETNCVKGGWVVYKKKDVQLIKGIAGVYNYTEDEWCKRCPDGTHEKNGKCEKDGKINPGSITVGDPDISCGENCFYIATYKAPCAKTGKDVELRCSKQLDGYDNSAGEQDDNNQKIIAAAKQQCEQELSRQFAVECPGDDVTLNPLDDVVKEMDVFFGKKTVWRTEDGKFNTLRLASDATAGVVLGTVGGLVSAKVIKKKQLEKGYDVLNCTIGGQKMADWGDVFNVDLRR